MKKKIMLLAPPVLLALSAWDREWSRDGFSYALWGIGLGVYATVLISFYRSKQS